MRVLAYCLMPNHFHLALWPAKDGDDRRVVIRHRQASPSAAPFGGSVSSLLGSRFLGLTPPGSELAPLAGLGKAPQRKRDEHKLDARPTFHHPSLALGR
jgi:hypothetical protein